MNAVDKQKISKAADRFLVKAVRILENQEDRPGGAELAVVQVAEIYANTALVIKKYISPR